MGRIHKIVKGKQDAPIRIVIYGVDGIGKSSFASNAPEPIFICAERGSAHLDVSRMPDIDSWQDIKDSIKELTEEKHGFQTVVVDTLDWAEPMLWDHICERDGQPGIEEYGYGRGYTAAHDEWRLFIGSLEKLVRTKHMNVVLIAHSTIKPFKNPAGEDYDRYEMKLHTKAGGLFTEWADAVLFAHYEVYTKQDKTKTKATSTGARIIGTEYSAAYNAKNRCSLAPLLPLDWSAFFDAAKGGTAEKTKDLIVDIGKARAKADVKTQEKIDAALDRAGKDTRKLSELLNWINFKERK